jgi:cell division septation protein DedD
MEDNNLDLLDLDDTDSMDSLPEANAFAAPRPKKPWLLLTVGMVVIVLATYIIIRAIGGESSSSMEVDLDVPAIVVDGAPVEPEINVMPPVKPVQVQPQKEAVKPVAQPVSKPEPKPEVQPVVQPEQSAGIPVRVIEDRKEVKFNPTKTEKPVAKTTTPAPKQGGVKPATKPAPKTAVKNTVANGGWYVQFGSYSSRALAESAQRKIQSQHQGLFAGKQFVILAAQLKNGTTTYRLRVAFANSNEANGFCRNAKADGLDCYVAR